MRRINNRLDTKRRGKVCNHLETIRLNSKIGKAERRQMHGRSFLVAPMTLIVPGVLNGSQGPLLYPQEEIAASVEDWNGMPIVVYHPMGVMPDGTQVEMSARDPSVFVKSWIGTIFNATMNGKLRAVGWFDEEITKQVDPRIYNALLRGQPMELSTGLYAENFPAPKGSSFKGIQYNYIARNYKPDHVAILPDEIGACSVKDGCGLLVNVLRVADQQERLGSHAWRKAIRRAFSVLSTKQITFLLNLDTGEIKLSPEDKRLGKDAAKQKRETGHNPPSWVMDEDIWAKAKAAADKGNYSGDTYWQVVVAIYKKMGGRVSAKASSHNKRRNPTMRTPKTFNRTKTINFLIANCDCWEEKDRALLNRFPDKKLLKLRKAVQAATKFNKLSAAIVGNQPPAGDGVDQEITDLFNWIKAAPPDVQKVLIDKLKEFMTGGMMGNPPVPVGGEEEDDVLNQLGIEDEEDEEEEDEDETRQGQSSSTVAKNRNSKGKKPAANKGKKQRDVDTEVDDLLAQITGNNGGKKVSKRKTANEWLQDAPPEIQRIVSNYAQAEKQQKVNIVKALTANIRDPKKRKAVQRSLLTKDLSDLQQQLYLVKANSPSGRGVEVNDDPIANYLGSGLGANLGNHSSGDDEDEETLDIPVMDWKEMAKANGRA